MHVKISAKISLKWGVPVYTQESTIALWSVVLDPGAGMVGGGVRRMHKKARILKNG